SARRVLRAPSPRAGRAAPGSKTEPRHTRRPRNVSEPSTCASRTAVHGGNGCVTSDCGDSVHFDVGVVRSQRLSPTMIPSAPPPAIVYATLFGDWTRHVLAIAWTAPQPRCSLHVTPLH